MAGVGDHARYARPAPMPRRRGIAPAGTRRSRRPESHRLGTRSIGSSSRRSRRSSKCKPFEQRARRGLAAFEGLRAQAAQLLLRVRGAKRFQREEAFERAAEILRQRRAEIAEQLRADAVRPVLADDEARRGRDHHQAAHGVRMVQRRAQREQAAQRPAQPCRDRARARPASTASASGTSGVWSSRAWPWPGRSTRCSV